MGQHDEPWFFCQLKAKEETWSLLLFKIASVSLWGVQSSHTSKKLF